MGLWPSEGMKIDKVAPAKAGSMSHKWIPACAAMTYLRVIFRGVGNIRSTNYCILKPQIWFPIKCELSE